MRRLRVERIDLYYLHRVHDDVGIEDSLEVIVRERDRGRIANIGVSSVDLAQLARARKVTEIAAVQNHYNLAHREHDDVLDPCQGPRTGLPPPISTTCLASLGATRLRSARSRSRLTADTTLLEPAEVVQFATGASGPRFNWP